MMHLMQIGTWLYTKFYGALVGEDQFGNRYYHSKNKREGAHVGRANEERRWVIYKGIREPSKVPPEWHGWLHHTTDETPKSGKTDKPYAWVKEHQINATGTQGAYYPAGHAKAGAKRHKATGDYTSWNPNN